MESERQYAEICKDTYSASSWGKSGTVSTFAETALGMFEHDVSDGTEESDEKSKQQTSVQDSADAIRARYEAMKANLAESSRKENAMFLQIKAQCINYLLALLFGINGEDEEDQYNYGAAVSSGISNEGGSYSEYHYCEQSETTSFSTSGTVVTQDGQKIGFGLNVTMSRQFVEELGADISYGTPQYCDPLVIQLDGTPGKVSDQTFSFDIDSDGIEDQINRMAYGSGFLTLDKNNDGSVNNGNELFGAESGNGFKDLEQYDDDGNGWIDENDSIFSRLKIWTKDRNGNDVFADLKSGGVGAISLRSAESEFSINDIATNEVQAKVRRTGFYLRENGTAGTIQQMDMVKKAYA